MIEKRQEREFWGFSPDPYRVARVKGLSTPTTGSWWVPEMASSMSEGVNLFESREQAIEGAKVEIARRINYLRHQIERLEELCAATASGSTTLAG